MLSPDECRALLRAGSIGRVAVSIDALPAIFPVRYRLEDDDILIHSARTGPAAVSVADAVIAFQADDFDAESATGWSVLVVGRAERAAESSASRIASDHISGYRFEGPDAGP